MSKKAIDALYNVAQSYGFTSKLPADNEMDRRTFIVSNNGLALFKACVHGLSFTHTALTTTKSKFSEDKLLATTNTKTDETFCYDFNPEKNKQGWRKVGSKGWLTLEEVMSELGKWEKPIQKDSRAKYDGGERTPVPKLVYRVKTTAKDRGRISTGECDDLKLIASSKQSGIVNMHHKSTVTPLDWKQLGFLWGLNAEVEVTPQRKDVTDAMENLIDDFKATADSLLAIGLVETYGKKANKYRVTKKGYQASEAASDLTESIEDADMIWYKAVDKMSDATYECAMGD